MRLYQKYFEIKSGELHVRSTQQRTNRKSSAKIYENDRWTIDLPDRDSDEQTSADDDYAEQRLPASSPRQAAQARR